MKLESDELIILAREQAEIWSDTQNHDPAFQRTLRVLREAYVAGFQRGFRAAEKIQDIQEDNEGKG